MDGQQLRVIEGNERGRRLSLDVDLLIGRLATDDEGGLGGDPEIRRHAYVSRGLDDRLMIEDLGSANGTFVNGERLVATRTLDLGDLVRVGKTVLQVTDPTGAVPEQPRPASEAPATGAPAAVAPRVPWPGRRLPALMVTAGVAAGRHSWSRTS